MANSLNGRVVVTGAFSYTGAAVARELQRRGFAVSTLTNRRSPEGAAIPAAPLRFEPTHLTRELSGSSALEHFSQLSTGICRYL